MIRGLLQDNPRKPVTRLLIKKGYAAAKLGEQSSSRVTDVT
jgi:hypothetical protein